MMRHLTIDSLIEFAEGQLSPQTKEYVQRHIASCAVCFAEASEWRFLLDSMKESGLESAPEYAVRNCLAIYGISKPLLKIVQFARVLFDSTLAPAVAGVRGAGDCQQLLFRAPDVDVHLRISGKPRVILGQLLERKAGRFLFGVPVGLLLADQPIEATITDTLGEFRFGNVPSGSLQLYADLSSYRLISDFTIKDEEIN
jgi:hypothetical protein